MFSNRKRSNNKPGCTHPKEKMQAIKDPFVFHKAKIGFKIASLKRLV